MPTHGSSIEATFNWKHQVIGRFLILAGDKFPFVIFFLVNRNLGFQIFIVVFCDDFSLEEFGVVDLCLKFLRLLALGVTHSKIYEI